MEPHRRKGTRAAGRFGISCGGLAVIRRRVRGAGATALLAVAAIACGPRVEPVDTARVAEREEDAEVLVYVRDRDGIPSCPWEVLGTVEVEAGWTEDEGDVRRVSRAAARLGGHAVMVETASSTEARILRFFDPLCNPVEEPAED